MKIELKPGSKFVYTALIDRGNLRHVEVTDIKVTLTRCFVNYLTSVNIYYNQNGEKCMDTLQDFCDMLNAYNAEEWEDKE